MTALHLRVHVAANAPETDGELLLHLRWMDGAVTTVFAADSIRPAVERWTSDYGLRELVKGEDGRQRPRMTLAHEPEFLQRLGENIERQTRFVVQVIEET